MTKPTPAGKERIKAPAGPVGVGGESVRWRAQSIRVPAKTGMATAVNLAKACDEERVRKPYSGNLYLRFDEGSGVTPAPTLPSLLEPQVSRLCVFAPWRLGVPFQILCQTVDHPG